MTVLRATPTRAAICLCDRVPSSGRLAISVADTTGPTPGRAQQGAEFFPNWILSDKPFELCVKPSKPLFQPLDVSLNVIKSSRFSLQSVIGSKP